MTGPKPARRSALLLAALALLSACAALPAGGPVVTEPGPEPVEQGAGSFDYTPPGPRAGSTPEELVDDFLLAMQASPQSTAIARKYLTADARAGWFPEKATLIYGSEVVESGPGVVEVGLEETVQLDDRGTWLGRVGGARGVRLRLEVARERGEWRIANPPDALVIPRSHFESRYQQFFVYYFDPTGTVLVPEPTYLPHGEQAATQLVQRLLRGPHPRLGEVLRSYIPGGTEYVLSVPVSESGVAEVELNEQLLRLGPDDREMALAQLAWTLRQTPGVESMRVVVDGAPFDTRGVGTPQSLASWAQFDPSIHWASQELFGLRRGEVLAVSPAEREVVGRFAVTDLGLRDIAVDLAGERLAGVSEDGTTVFLASRSRSDVPVGPEEADVVATGSGLLRPAWDVFGQLWLVDRTASGTRVRVLFDGDADPVDAPGLEGADVSHLTVSRDGSRVVAVVREGEGDRLVVSRVMRGPGGRVRGLTRAVDLPLAQGGVDEIRDLAWRSPGSLAVLTGPTPVTSQVLLALVDGSTAAAGVDSAAEIFPRRAVRVAAAPSPGTGLYLGDRAGRVFELGGDGQWVEAELPARLRVPTFVG